MLSCILLVSCASQHKISRIRREGMGAAIMLSQEYTPAELEYELKSRPDTLTVEGQDGKQMIIMKAYKDEDGQMTATDVIDAAVVTARFRNVAERHGKVDIGFDIAVPEEMQDSKWQLRFSPRMAVLGDTISLDQVIITGKDYRKAQLRGYQQYQKFVSSIITDTLKFIDIRQLEIFLERNLPEVFAFRSDTSYVSDEEFRSAFGVTEQEAIDHYTNMFAKRSNERKKLLKDKMFHKYVKSPILSEGLRLDTVMTSADGDFIYHYVQTIETAPGLRKVDLVMDGAIFELDKQLYTIPRTDPLTFYISSLSTLSDGTVRYLKSIVTRKVKSEMRFRIMFETDKHQIKEGLGENASEISRMKAVLRSLAANEEFDLDSVTVSASSSPEGSFQHNSKLSQLRGKEVCDYFSDFVRKYRDSLARSEIRIQMDDSFEAEKPAPIIFSPECLPEDWDRLDGMVAADSLLSISDKSIYMSAADLSDPDAREKALHSMDAYPYLLNILYPELRTVRFDFHLTRRGMTRDTISTTVIDSVYMAGVQAIRDRDYKKAVSLLRPYNDFNTAVAYCALDYDESALSILRTLEENASRDYLMAILYSRKGRDSEAAGYYLQACKLDPAFIHRGNLDPEISALIKRYNLTKQTQLL